MGGGKRVMYNVPDYYHVLAVCHFLEMGEMVMIGGGNMILK